MKGVIYPLRVIHGKIHDWLTFVLPLIIERLRNYRAVYLVYTPEHGNLGDHAIAESETQLLNELGIPFMEVTGRMLKKWEDYNCLQVMNGRTIIINGGGNLGTIWPDIERTIRNIIKKNPLSKILICPSTFFYESDENGRIELEKSKQIYNSHKYLHIYARERESYEKMRGIYHNVYIAPDMVFRLNQCKLGETRHGGILCLRRDRERTRSDLTEQLVRDQMNQLFGEDVIDLDMKKDYAIPISKRKEELEKQFNAFRHSKLVITDRLHAMIFCVITGTPCIVIDSKSPKVRGCYEWIKDLPYIQFCDKPEHLTRVYAQIPEREWKYDNSKLIPLYETLENSISSMYNRKRKRNS